MDITNFINSRDIRDYHREIDYKYNALEAAWLVYKCRDINVRQRHEAWNWIIRNMPDCKVSNVRIRTCFYNKSVHKVIAEYIELERGFIDSFMSESGYLYTYRHSCKIGDDGEVDIVNGEGVFTSAEKCIEHIIKEEDPKETKFAEISRRVPDEGEYYNRHGSIVINLRGEMIDVKIETKDDSESNLIDLECFFDDLWFAFPVPFKRGDIVFVSNRLGTEEPVVLTDIVIPPGWEREKYINMRLEHGGDTSDMNLYGYMMTDNSRYIGPFTEIWWNYMDVEYYRKELTGINRVLKIISNWLKGEFGDDLCLLLAGYHRILLEEVLAKTTPLMYTSEGLMSAGFPIKKN